MKTSNMNRLLIEATVHRTLERLTEAPEREIRNLIDMGMEFSEGRFQKQIFSTAQTMLQNPDSAYYTLVKHAANHIDHERLLSLGMNIGYESCTRGAAIIRDIEGRENYNIPWALTLSLDNATLVKHPDYYDNLLNQSTALGIYTTLLFVNDALFSILPILKSQPHVAFILFINGAQITDEWLEAINDINNIAIAVFDDAYAARACEKLYNAHMIFGIYHQYNEGNVQQVTSEAWLENVLHLHPSFVILTNEAQCPLRTTNAVFDFIQTKRESQRYPFILMDLQHDLQLIDQIISDDLCMVGFDSNGNLHTIDGRSPNSQHNFFKQPLATIFMDALKK